MPRHPDEITLAARAMTEVEPPSDLEAKIARRLDAVTTIRPTSGRWPIVAGFATVMAMVIIAVTVRSPEVPRSRGPEVRGEVPLARGPEVPEGPVPRSPEVPESARAAVPSPIRLPSYRSISASEWEWMARRVPALDPIDAIQPERVSITPLTMAPLTTLPMYGDPDGGQP